MFPSNCSSTTVVSVEISKQLVTSFVLQRIDYCNSLLVNLPASTTASLQRVQNDAARLIIGLDRRALITPALKKLHWLPVQCRIQFKIAVLMHQCFHRRCPQYIFDLVSFRTGTGRLRSATTRAAVTHRPRTNLGGRTFSIAGPSVWNSLPQSLRLIDDHEQFRKQLKTYYFNVAFTEADLGMCGLCGRTGAPTKGGPHMRTSINFFIAANLLQHANMPKNH